MKKILNVIKNYPGQSIAILLSIALAYKSLIYDGLFELFTEYYNSKLNIAIAAAAHSSIEELTYDVTEELLTLIVYILAGYCIAQIVGSFKDTRDLHELKEKIFKTKVENLERLINELKANIEPDNQLEEVTESQVSLAVRLEIAVDEKTKLKQPINKPQSINWLFLIVCTIWLSIYFIRYDIISDSKILISQFSNEITILTPFIDNREKELILSNWARMDNSEDFFKLHKEIEIIAQQNEIVLPENKFILTKEN